MTPDSEREWKANLEKIKSLGFNTVRTWVEWNVGEPREGEYHLENLDLLLKLAQEKGLKAIVQVYVDSAPEWVGVKYPDGRYAAQDGQHPARMHPLAALLMQCAGIAAPELQAPSLLELRQMRAPQGRLLFLFNHGEAPAHVVLSRELDRPAKSIREIATGARISAEGMHLRLEADVPAHSVRIYRIDE